MEIPAYIPILKWQSCEQHALSCLDAGVRERVLPCLEIREERLHRNFVQSYSKYWDSAALFDYSNPEGFLGTERTLQLLQTIRDCQRHSLPLIPVLNPEDPICHPTSTFIENYVKDRNLYLRPRINIDELPQLLNNVVIPLLERCNKFNVDVGVLLDLGCTPNLSTYQENLLVSFLKTLSSKCKSPLYIASGAYPGTLAHIGQGSGSIQRRDWLLWQRFKEGLHGVTLGYSDYVSICPTWTEEIKMKNGPLAIRYTTSDKWLITRGGSEKTKEEAINLSKIFFSVYKPHVESKDFSIGDRNLYEKADDYVPMRNKRCSAADHVWEALIHHITYVVKRQLRFNAEQNK